MYYKSFYAYDGGQFIPVIIRNYVHEDFDQLIQLQRESFPPPFPSELWWNIEQLHNHVTLFPTGALCVEIDGTIVGSMTSLVISFDPLHPNHSWEEITDNGYIESHTEEGNTLYIVDICVHPSHRKLGLGKWMMFSMYEIVIELGLDRLLGGGRIPGYHKVADQLTVDQYVASVIKGQQIDPVITFLLRCGRTPIHIIPNYLEDKESLDYAVLMEWKNPFKAQHSINKETLSST